MNGRLYFSSFSPLNRLFILDIDRPSTEQFNDEETTTTETIEKRLMMTIFAIDFRLIYFNYLLHCALGTVWRRVERVAPDWMFYFSDHHKIQKETMATYGFAVNKTVNQPSFPDDCQLDEASTDWKTAVTPFLCHRSNEEKKRTTRQNPDTQTRNSSSSNSNADATIQRIENEKIPKLWLCLFVCLLFFFFWVVKFCVLFEIFIRSFSSFFLVVLACWRGE